MTATVEQPTVPEPGPAAPAGDPLRILSIAANLLPVEIIDSRRDRRVKACVVAGLVALVVLLAAWFGVAALRTAAARVDLDTAQNDAQTLVQRQHAYQKVVQTQAASKAITTQLSAVLAQDLPWSTLLAAMRKAEPSGVELTGISGSLTMASSGTTGGASSTASGLPERAGEKSIGTITVNGTGTGKIAIAAYSDALGLVGGLGNPLLSSVSTTNGKLEFVLRADITVKALGGRYSTARATK